MRPMRHFLSIILLLALSGCAAAQSGVAATPPPQPTVPGVAEALSESPAGHFVAIGYLYMTGQGASLVNRLSFSQGEAPVPLDQPGAIWLPDPPPIPADTAIESRGDVRYLIVRAQGRISAVGSYGPDGSYPYQLSEVLLEPLSVRAISIPLLLANSGIYDNQPVRMEGQILLSGSTALLVESLGSGGVPLADATQIKLLGPIDDDARLHAQLSAGGAARYGPVTIIGIWRRSGLYPLAIIPL